MSPAGLRLVLLTCQLLTAYSTALPLVLPSSPLLRNQTPKILSSKYSQEKFVGFFIFHVFLGLLKMLMRKPTDRKQM